MSFSAAEIFRILARFWPPRCYDLNGQNLSEISVTILYRRGGGSGRIQVTRSVSF